MADSNDPTANPPPVPVVIRHAHAVQVPYHEDDDPSKPSTPIAKAYRVPSGTFPGTSAAVAVKATTTTSNSAAVTTSSASSSPTSPTINTANTTEPLSTEAEPTETTEEVNNEPDVNEQEDGFVVVDAAAAAVTGKVRYF